MTIHRNNTIWPIENTDALIGVPIDLMKWDQWNAKTDFNQSQILAITDGWRDGQIGAVLRGGSNARAVLDLLSQSGVRSLKIIHLEEKLPQLEDIFFATVVNPAYAMFDSVNIVWRRESSVIELVSNIGRDYSMLFMGAPLTISEVTPLYEALREVFTGSLTFVRGPVNNIEINEQDEIFKWVRSRTYEASDFSIAASLRSDKMNRDQKIAVLLPSLNEERTVGNVIQAALEAKEAGFIDEVILIDSASVDRTVEIAKDMGIPVFLHPEIRPELGSFHGKGEAMFKSAFVTDADILAWVDTDIETITPRFFYGLLGPLLSNPNMQFVKGYFARPTRVESSGLELGGGRVTEILARPWINTFSPDLSGYIQPLSGTVAIRRQAYQKMSIPVNYGVEIAMLLQVVQNEGLWSTCQVNLGDVVHKSKDVIGLSEMAFQIIQVLAEMTVPVHGLKTNNLLRRVYSAHGNFEIGIKNFSTQWRNFQNETLF